MAGSSYDPPFYMYNTSELDFSWLQSCAGFSEFRHSSRGEGLGEVGFHLALERHPARTLEPCENQNRTF